MHTILYIRQSSAYQVTHNLESQKLQKHAHGETYSAADTPAIDRDKIAAYGQKSRA